jgi:cytolysin-activating lysine-acyltransferase
MPLNNYSLVAAQQVNQKSTMTVNPNPEQTSTDDVLSLATSMKIMGAVVWMMQSSPLHRNYSVEMLLKRIGPSLQNNQFRYYEDPQRGPIAFCNWAFLSDNSLNQIISTGRDPEAHEWASGKNPYFVEMIAPFGHCRRVVRDLREAVFSKGQRGFAIRGQVYRDDPNGIRLQKFHS